jgi:NAD(P)H-dependent FMN reductase
VTEHFENSNVLVILGSTRAGRICPTIAAWVIGIARASTNLDYEVVDLLDWHLPTHDEPGIPALGGYMHDHTQAWSRKVAGAAAVVFVTPQYNWGYPAPLKNAIDHLYKEWTGKSLVIVSYGGHGGNKCAAQLRQVAEGLHMRTVRTMPAIELTDDMIKNASVDPDKDFSLHVDAVRRAFAELVAQIQGG